MIVPPPSTGVALPVLDGLRVLGGGETSGQIAVGVRAEGAADYESEFSAGERVVIEGEFMPEEAELDFPGALFVVARLTTPSGYTAWFNQNLDGRFVRWNGKVPSLVPAHEREALGEVERIVIHQGTLPAGDYALFLGYMVDGTVFIYTGTPHRFTVSSAAQAD